MAPSIMSSVIMAANGSKTPISEKEIDSSSRPGPEYRGFDHITWFVGNAKQAASYYITRMGFKEIAYRGIETGSRCTTSRVVANGAATLVLTSPVRGPLAPGQDKTVHEEERLLLNQVHDHLAKHGDGVKDVAFQVDDVASVWTKAVARGASSVQEPIILAGGADGEVLAATLRTFGETTHTLIDRSKYHGNFLPGFRAVTGNDPVSNYLPTVPFIEIDHCVGNQPWHKLDSAVEYYEQFLDFHRFWTVDDKNMCTDFSAMRSTVVASPNEVIKMPLNEPAKGIKKSQIEEFVDYYNGSGVQHIAFRTIDIVTAVTNLRARGLSFLSVPDTYYIAMHHRLKINGMHLDEDLAVLQKLNILVDFDEGGYLLQIFAKHVLDRPTVFVEIIQRNNFDGFGAGNFKSLFEAFERDQAERGNL